MRALKLRAVNRGRNRFCGPAVISILTGMDTDEASQAIRSITGRRQITRTTTLELVRTLKQQGIVMRELQNWSHEKPIKRPTITQWLRQSKEVRTAGRVYLLSAGHHWQLISGRRFVCGLTGEVVSIRDKKAGRRRRVKAVWLLERREDKIESGKAKRGIARHRAA